jgi:hypothetical protein
MFIQAGQPQLTILALHCHFNKSVKRPLALMRIVLQLWGNTVHLCTSVQMSIIALIKYTVK